MKDKTTQDLELIYEQRVVEMAFGMDTFADSITQEQLVEKIRAADKTGATPVSITAVTIPQQKKGGNTFLPIYKVSQINGMIGADYGGSVERQRAREGKEGGFKAGSGWGEHETPSLVRGKNGLSMAIQPTQRSGGGKRQPVYVGTQGGNFKVLTPEEWGPFVSTQKPEDTAASQGVDRPVIYRRVLVSNIAGITIGGKEYGLSDLDQTKQEVLKTAQVRDVDVF